jgi:hypothetical protein
MRFASVDAAERNALEPLPDERLVRRGTERRQTLALRPIHFLADPENRNGQLRLVGHEFVHVTNQPAPLLDLPLLPRRRLRDPPLEPLLLDPPHLPSSISRNISSASRSSFSVSASTWYEPPSGSMTLGTPLT